MGVTFPLQPVMGTSLDYHDLPNMMDNGIVTSSALSLRTHRHISSGPMDLWNFQFLRWSQTRPSPTAGGSSFSSPFLCPLQLEWLEHLLVKTKAKKSLITYVFSIPQEVRSTISFQKGPTFCLILLLFTSINTEAFLVASDIPGQI